MTEQQQELRLMDAEELELAKFTAEESEDWILYELIEIEERRRKRVYH